MRIVSAEGRISVLFVEVYAVIARVVKNTVEDDVDFSFFCFGAKRFEIVFTAEQGVDFHIVRCVVAMV